MCLDLFKDISDPFYSYVIAEIGNNHQGSLEHAFKLIDEAKECGADAVKFQKRCNNKLFIPDFYNSPYINPNSFGETYGMHRDALELTIEQMAQLKSYADKIGITFFCTPFDEQSLEELESLNLGFYKVASADLVHTPFLKLISKTKKNLIISTGYATYEDIDRALENILHNNKVAILHCTAAYPAPIESMNLNCIENLIDRYPNNIIGISDHENGIDAALISYMKGARVFEKHFTLNRSNKGTDNAFSLEPTGLKKLVRNLRRIPKMLGNKDKFPLEIEKAPISKMRKSIVYKNSFKKGTVLNFSSFEFRCPALGLNPFDVEMFNGKILKRDVKQFEFASFEDI